MPISIKQKKTLLGLVCPTCAKINNKRMVEPENTDINILTDDFCKAYLAIMEHIRLIIHTQTERINFDLKRY